MTTSKSPTIDQTLPLFDLPQGVNFQTAKERYGLWPTTVWECPMNDPLMRDIKKRIVSCGGSRLPDGNLSYCKSGTVNIFNPLIALWAIKLFAPSSGVCFDPFAGGGTCAIVAASCGLSYIGIELREEEAQVARLRCQNVGISDNVAIIVGDARDSVYLLGDTRADFLLTDPPYWNLEPYHGGLGDLSMLETYDEFCAELEKVVRATYDVLKPEALSCWVVGMHRDKSGGLLTIHHDVTRMHRRAGFRVEEEVVVHVKGSGAIRRVGNFERGQRHLIRTHVYVLVYRR